MHCCADVFRRDENVRLARLFLREKAIANWMDRQFAGNKVSLDRQDISILPDPGDLACKLEVAQHSSQRDSCTAAYSNLSSDLDLV